MASAAAAIDRILATVPPSGGAAVMATGIVSVALVLDGRKAASRVLLVLAAVVWVLLAALAAVRARREPERLRAEATRPGALTGVAGTCVLGTRLTLEGWCWAGAALLAVGAVLWIPLVVAVLRRRRRPAPGAVFLVAVSAQAVAVLGAVVADRGASAWLLAPSAAALVAGLGLYVVAFRAFDLREVLTGAGDQWVAGGALAISALAAADLDAAARVHAVLAGLRPWLGAAAVVLWALAVAWLPGLLAGELARPRLRFAAARWATVFPLGMYAAMSFAVGRIGRHPWMIDAARVLVWAAAAAWAVVAAGALARGARLLRRP